MALHGAAQLRFMDQQERNQTSCCAPNGKRAHLARLLTSAGCLTAPLGL